MKQFLIFIFTLFIFYSCSNSNNNYESVNDSKYEISKETKECNISLLGQWKMINQKDSLFITMDGKDGRSETFNHNFSREVACSDSIQIPWSIWEFYNDNTTNAYFYDVFKDKYVIDSEEYATYELVNNYLLINHLKYENKEKSEIYSLNNDTLIVRSPKEYINKSEILQWELDMYDKYNDMINISSAYHQYYLTFEKINN